MPPSLMILITLSLVSANSSSGSEQLLYTKYFVIFFWISAYFLRAKSPSGESQKRNLSKGPESGEGCAAMMGFTIVQQQPELNTLIIVIVSLDDKRRPKEGRGPV